MRNRTLARIALFCAFALPLRASAQDTFSIVAIDPATGEVGSAGASCLGLDVALISDVHPGVGAVHTQSYHLQLNKDYGNKLMKRGLSPQEIMDSLVAYDVEGNPGVRQYGAVALANGGTSAAYTGANCLDFKAHRLGPTYAIQGNILAGPAILDSMEARFLRATGSLADRLMEAMQGANVVGADARCVLMGTSSLAAFLRVAKPGDAETSLGLDLRAVIPSGSSEPIDSLQRMYNRWKVGAADERSAEQGGLHLEIHPNPAGRSMTASFTSHRSGPARLSLIDAQGREVAVLADRAIEAGINDLRFDVTRFPAGVYYCRLGHAGRVATAKLVLPGE